LSQLATPRPALAAPAAWPPRRSGTFADALAEAHGEAGSAYGEVAELEPHLDAPHCARRCGRAGSGDRRAQRAAPWLGWWRERLALRGGLKELRPADRSRRLAEIAHGHAALRVRFRAASGQISSALERLSK